MDIYICNSHDDATAPHQRAFLFPQLFNCFCIEAPRGQFCSSRGSCTEGQQHRVRDCSWLLDNGHFRQALLRFPDGYWRRKHWTQSSAVRIAAPSAPALSLVPPSYAAPTPTRPFSVAAAIAKQATNGIHLQQNCMISQPMLELIEELRLCAPAGLSRFFFNCEAACGAVREAACYRDAPFSHLSPSLTPRHRLRGD
jgi:hypothetical protein